ncbi:hypothetical protein HPB50_018911 [Hyalomma asiaticum]|uniref:Uncharacterized protein n=1 Tax=Hyalomma asiaticum TaxID=266040 RepID=A0ACB7TRE0_HYAAI|nr:hypothetical protein HPB50_018911 [Hyalomma asiaticum]
MYLKSAPASWLSLTVAGKTAGATLKKRFRPGCARVNTPPAKNDPGLLAALTANQRPSCFLRGAEAVQVSAIFSFFMLVCLLLPLFLKSSFSMVRAGGVSCLVMTPHIPTTAHRSELAEFPGAIDGSTFDEFVSADDVTITGQLQDEDYVPDVVPTTSQSGSNKEIDDGPLPTSSEVISALALDRRYCVNMEGCGLSCSDSLDNVLLQAAKSLKQKKIQDYVFCSKVGHASKPPY